MHVRVCVDCGEEFRPETARCSDCGGALKDHFPGEGGLNEALPPASTPPGGHEPKPLVFAADARNLVPVAEALRAAGIPTRITEREVKPGERHPGFDLGVRDADRSMAMAALELAAESVSGVTVLDAPVVAEGALGEVNCPACGTPVTEGVTECQECGLILGAEPGE